MTEAHSASVKSADYQTSLARMWKIVQQGDRQKLETRGPLGSSSGGLLSGVKYLGRRLLLSEYFILYLTIANFLILAVFFPDLVTARNLSNQLANVWPLFAVAIGQTFVLIVMGIDLSQGAIMGRTSVVGGLVVATGADPALLGGSPVWGSLLSESGGVVGGASLSVAAGVMGMLAAGCLIGFFNGYFIAQFNMPAFMVTLVALMLFSSAGIWLTQSQNITHLPDAFSRLGGGDIVSVYLGEKTEATIKRRDLLPFVTYPMLITLLLAILADIILRFTVLGRHIMAVGGNVRAAEISGVPVRRVIIFVFAFSGFCAAVASILYSARLGGFRPTIGAGSALLDIIGATVIGGTSLAGGKGKISWTAMGVVFFVLLGNMLNSIGLSAFYIDVVKGAIILAAAALDVTRTRLLASGSVP
jgi:ribose/xylose/arabinose/galactoside ABC-type transport system permease subunit